jgi:Rps23 Pro-64 3,4-dihydroxylase Tpa1-like proline 4-hydroxylase
MISPDLAHQLRDLSRQDKLNVIQFLAAELNLTEAVSQSNVSAAVPSIVQAKLSQPGYTTITSNSAIATKSVAKIVQQTAFSTATDVTISRFLQLQNFLSSTEHAQLVEYAVAQEADFVSTTTSTGAANYRESRVLYNFPEWRSLMANRIREALPEVLQTLELDEFEITEIEAQLTAHNDGNFYRIHNDNGSKETETRLLTYVYYFNHYPKNFWGGGLRIYDTTVKNNYFVAADSYHDVQPDNNSIVFFLSRYMHEVLPITCPSGAFIDSRFTINGWLRTPTAA